MQTSSQLRNSGRTCVAPRSLEGQKRRAGEQETAGVFMLSCSPVLRLSCSSDEKTLADWRGLFRHSGRLDSNQRLPAPKAGTLTRLSYAPLLEAASFYHMRGATATIDCDQPLPAPAPSDPSEGGAGAGAAAGVEATAAGLASSSSSMYTSSSSVSSTARRRRW